MNVRYLNYFLVNTWVRWGYKILVSSAIYLNSGIFTAEPKQLSLTTAISETISNQWDIFISEMQIQNQSGVYQSSEEPFDPIFNLSGQYEKGKTWAQQYGIILPAGPFFIPGAGLYESTPPEGIQVDIFTTTITAEIQKKIRFGTEFSLQVSAQNNYNPLYNLSTGYDFLGEYTAIGTSTITFTIDQPLLKGLWSSKETMNEKSQKLQVEATKCSFINEVSAQVLNTTLAYWDLIRAHKILHLYKLAEDQNQLFVQEISQIIEKNQMPRTQLSQPLKDLASSRASMASAKQSIIDAAQALAIAMGAPEKFITYCNENLQLDNFPKSSIYERIPCQTTTKAATQYAVSRRYDLKALDFYRKAIEMEVKGAFNETLPSLDLEVQGITTNSVYPLGKPAVFGSFKMPHPQKEWSVELSLNFPIFRDYGKGQYKSAKAQKRQADLKYGKLQNQIITEVIQALNDHNAILEELQDVQATVQQATIYLEQQKKLFQFGLTDLFELLQSHTDQVEQQVRLISVETSFCKNIANIRYLLGTIVKGNPFSDQIQINEMTSLPQELFLQMLGVK